MTQTATVKPLMARATAVWLVDNTALTFAQIARFCDLHPLEVQGIADGEVAVGVKGLDPIANHQLTSDEIAAAEANADHSLRLRENPAAEGEERRRGPRYTPLSKRQDRPAAILWLVRNHSELTDAEISRLVGTTKPTIQSIRQRTHWNISSIQPTDPVALGLCKQGELDKLVQVGAARKAAQAAKRAAAEAEEWRKSGQAGRISSAGTDSRLPSAIANFDPMALEIAAGDKPAGGDTG